MKNMLFFVAIHSFVFLISACFFVALFAFGSKIESSNFFFRGVLYCFITGCFSALMVLVIKKTINGIVYQDVVLAFFVSTLMLLVFFTHIPVTADRSLTIYLLGKMSTHPESTYKKQELEKLLIEQYIVEYGAVNKRIDEQIIIGTIKEDSSEYNITKKGYFLIKFYQITAKIFKIDSNLIKPNDRD